MKSNVHLILADGAELKAEKGIEVNENNSLTIYGQIGNTGKIVAEVSGDGWSNTAIGGNEWKNSGIITITGGTVTAASKHTGAGIGGGNGATSGNTFTTEANGKAIIETSSISDLSGKNNWKGIIFEGNAGTVYGNQELNEDFEIKNPYYI